MMAGQMIVGDSVPPGGIVLVFIERNINDVDALFVKIPIIFFMPEQILPQDNTSFWLDSFIFDL
jgi:hypothetical protein